MNRRTWLLPLPFAALLCLAMLIPLLATPGTAQEASPEACTATTPEENVELANQWFAAQSANDSEAVGQLATDDVVYHAPSPDLPPITESAESWADDRFQDFPDLSATVEHAFATDDMAAAYVRYAGTHSGDTEDQLGVPATGQTVEWVVMVHLRFECGEIAEIWSVGDELGKLQRMGVITADELLSVEPVATPAP